MIESDPQKLDLPSWHPKNIRDRTPIGKDALGRPLIPSEYEVKKFLMSTVRKKEDKGKEVNQGFENEVFDIASFVHDFTITEELWSPTIMLRMRFRDNVNLFNIMQLDGRERIYLELEKKDWENVDRPYTPLKLNFVVYEYPSIETTEETLDVKYFTCTAISEFTYLSSIQRMSRSVGGLSAPGKDKNPTKNIVKIFEEFLQTKIKDPNEGPYKCDSTFQGVLIDQQPLEAINYLLSKSFDGGKSDEYATPSQSPFLLYNTIDPEPEGSPLPENDDLLKRHNIQLRSWHDIEDSNEKNWFADMHKPGSKPFILKRTFEYSPDPDDVGHKEYYDEVKRQITNLRSDLNINILEDLLGGYYGTRQNIITYAGRGSTIEMEFEEPAYKTESERKYITQTPAVKEIETAILDKEHTISTQVGTNPFGFLSITSPGKFIALNEQQKVAIKPGDPLTNDTAPYGVIGASPIDLHIPSDLFQTERGAQQAHDINKEAPGTYVYRHYFKKIIQTMQEITVFGDFKLNPGKHIKIWLPKNLNLKEIDADSEEGANSAKDEITSGEYIIAKTTHKFAHGGYMCVLQLVRPTRGKLATYN